MGGFETITKTITLRFTVTEIIVIDQPYSSWLYKYRYSHGGLETNITITGWATFRVEWTLRNPENESSFLGNPQSLKPSHAQSGWKTDRPITTRHLLSETSESGNLERSTHSRCLASLKLSLKPCWFNHRTWETIFPSKWPSQLNSEQG
jgi:hypothetical protein